MYVFKFTNPWQWAKRNLEIAALAVDSRERASGQHWARAHQPLCVPRLTCGVVGWQWAKRNLEKAAIVDSVARGQTRNR